jgi:hypothetical protein
MEFFQISAGKAHLGIMQLIKKPWKCQKSDVECAECFAGAYPSKTKDPWERGFPWVLAIDEHIPTGIHYFINEMAMAETGISTHFWVLGRFQSNYFINFLLFICVSPLNFFSCNNTLLLFKLVEKLRKMT